ncbi:hypothetical protein RchiOBHm_Chr3g0463421 [Rosa chinensis]|uniref:Uncharacterized protein n=1 Tax=Rosa chinensis TaxID=74649 RepID=A0A2P6R974_ROSCH|nr:hypothetical protein RchiOBHm_Chr3g0463421 [Rosa chinensis]
MPPQSLSFPRTETPLTFRKIPSLGNCNVPNVKLPVYESFDGDLAGRARFGAVKVTVENRDFSRFPAIPAVSGHQIGVEDGAAKFWWPSEVVAAGAWGPRAATVGGPWRRPSDFPRRYSELLLDEGSRMRDRLNSTVKYLILCFRGCFRGFIEILRFDLGGSRRIRMNDLEV